MNGSRTARLLPWTGPLYTVVFIVAVALQGSTPDEKDSARQVMDYYNSHQGRTLASVFLAPLAAALLILFFSYLRTLARERGVMVGPGPTVLIGGATVWASGLLLGATSQLMVVSASDHRQGQVAQTANVLSNDTWIPFIAGIAITMFGAGLTVLGSDLLPRWLGWTAVVVGVVSLMGPGGFLGFFVAPLWMLVAGVLLFKASLAPAPYRTRQAADRRSTQDA